MTRSTWSLLSIAALLGAALAGITLAMHVGEPPPGAPEMTAVAPQIVEPATPGAPVTEVDAPAGITAATIAQWAAESMGPDAEKRAEAIAALANAPREEAIPVLRNVLTSGESRIDRPLALRSLRALAQRDGDADGAIRDVLRQSVYHADNEEFTRAAQSTLDDVEGFLTQR